MIHEYLVSVRLMVYNHELYIREAIEGIIKQNTNFLIEVIIGDDFSTDRSLEIIREYKNTTNIHFKILERNVGDEYWQNRQKLGRLHNFYNIIDNCSGKYIALLDGDDYWTDPLKLQKQVDFLEANQNYAGCFHKIKAKVGLDLIEDTDIEIRYEKVSDKDKITRIDLLREGNFIHSCSFMYRNKSFVFSEELIQSPVGDILFFLSICSNGYFKRIDDYMAVYRRGTGIYSSLSNVEMSRKKMEYHLCILSSLVDSNERKLFLKNSLELMNQFEKIIRLDEKSTFIKNIDYLKILIFRFIKKIKN
jgi:glycosyltransferase involved in cell wall biosynthesis